MTIVNNINSSHWRVKRGAHSRKLPPFHVEVRFLKVVAVSMCFSTQEVSQLVSGKYIHESYIPSGPST